jgi:transketolase C-terminal domain/subunit/transketolase N-terminal domain/subunit
MSRFPIDLGAYQRIALDPRAAALTAGQRAALQANVALCRDAIIFFTAVADARGLGGHTGGPYDVVPEAVLADAFMAGSPSILPVLFDEAGHRVALQYLWAALKGQIAPEHLLRYREAGAGLPGHPERGMTPGLQFSSGRLGHLWPYVNGVALANPGKTVLLFGSDGAQMEGNDAEAARLCVALGLPVKLLLDDNDVTISGHPSEYLRGFDLARTLSGHGLPVDVGDGEDLDALHARMARALSTPGPVALINKRKMAPGVAGIEGSSKGHDVIKAQLAVQYLEARGHGEAAQVIKAQKAAKRPTAFRGVGGGEWGKNRETFGTALCEVLATLSPEQRLHAVRVFDSDLEGSCGLHHVKKAFPEIYLQGGIMERGNYSAAAGFGMQRGQQGVFATFSAFLEMVISEITMARLNDAHVLAHFSHAGVDDMADNTCHFGLNNFFADNGLCEGDHTRLYFPADQHQMRAVVKRVFADPGLRFVFSTRSPVPDILGADGRPLFGGDYVFEPGKDEVIREGSAGYVVSYGEMLFRCLHAVETLREGGLDVGLVHKATLNVIDEAALARVGKSRFVLVVESQNRKTGLGARYGSWLLSRGLHPRYEHLGSTRLGGGGLWEQMTHQGLDAADVVAAAKRLSQ